MTLDESGVAPEAMAAVARATANKLLHAPTRTIKSLIAAGDEQAPLSVLASYGVTMPTIDPLAPARIAMQEAS